MYRERGGHVEVSICMEGALFVFITQLFTCFPFAPPPSSLMASCLNLTYANKSQINPVVSDSSYLLERAGLLAGKRFVVIIIWLTNLY